jgi:hypothetical protein
VSEHATAEAEDQAPRRRGRRYAFLVLGLGLLAGAAGLGVAVGSWTPPDPPPAAASPSTTPPAGPAAPPPAWGVRRKPLDLPDFRGRTVAEASAAGQAAGANLVIFDARWNRPVQPDWVVCGTGEPVYGNDWPTGDFDISAVPAGDPCP